MALWSGFKFWNKKEQPLHLARGELGEKAAKEFLQNKGLKFLTANFKSARGEIDLIFRDGDGLVFVEVKTRSNEDWSRPARAVDLRKKKALARAALDYLGLLENPGKIPYRFDVMEVLLENGNVREVRHIERGFSTENLWKKPRR